MDDKEKKLNLMRFWLFGTFAIVWSAVTAYGYLVFSYLSPDRLFILKLPVYWIITVSVALLCVVVYFIYKWLIKAGKQ